MSAIVILPVLLPTVGPAVWPLFAAAAAAAASTLGYAGTSTASAAAGRTVTNEVVLDGLTCSEVAETLVEGDAIVFTKGDVTLSICRDAAGKVSVRAASETRSKAELQAVGEEMIGKVVQQYAYHRIVTEMKNRNLNVVDQTVEDDGTVRMKVRVYHE